MEKRICVVIQSCLNFSLIKCGQLSVEVQLKLIKEDYAQQLLGIWTPVLSHRLPTYFIISLNYLILT